ncbi:MAG: hypothetical protein SNG35_00310 [Rikenellaceae bacterium]
MALKFSLSRKTKNSISRTTGLSEEQIVKMSSSDLDNAIGAKMGRQFKLDLSKSNRYIAGRGSVYLALARFIRLDVDKEIGKI